MTHAQYLREPDETVEWMLLCDAAEKQAQAEAERDAAARQRVDEVPQARRRLVLVRASRLGPVLRAAMTTPGARTTEELGFTPEQEEALEDLADTLMWAVTASWTLPDPLPDGPHGFGALPRALRDAVADATAGEAAELLQSAVG